MNHDWPSDADSDALRRMLAHGVDFAKPHTVDFNVDFARWPPAPAAIKALQALYGSVALYSPNERGNGYAQFQIHGLVAYEWVMRIQRITTAAMRPFGGVCESWGVMQDPP